MGKRVYIAHPISGDVEGNIEKVLQICRRVHLGGDIPIVPYVSALLYLDDKPEQIKLGMEASKVYFDSKFIEEVLLCGPEISSEMRIKVGWAYNREIPVRCDNPDLEMELEKILEEHRDTDEAEMQRRAHRPMYGLTF